MHPLDVKISLSNEINVIRIECVKQKKNPFSNLSHLPSFLGLHITQRFTVPRLWHWGTPGSLHPLPDYRQASPPFSGGKRELWFGERGLS